MEGSNPVSKSEYKKLKKIAKQLRKELKEAMVDATYAKKIYTSEYKRLISALKPLKKEAKKLNRYAKEVEAAYNDAVDNVAIAYLVDQDTSVSTAYDTSEIETITETPITPSKKVEKKASAKQTAEKKPTVKKEKKAAPATKKTSTREKKQTTPTAEKTVAPAKKSGRPAAAKTTTTSPSKKTVKPNADAKETIVTINKSTVLLQEGEDGVMIHTPVAKVKEVKPMPTRQTAQKAAPKTRKPRISKVFKVESDLLQLDGVGAKGVELFNSIKVFTLRDLINTRPSDIKELLAGTRGRLHSKSPEDWIEEAKNILKRN